MGNKKVFKAGMGYVISNYLIKGITFLTLPLFARILSTADFGTYNVFLSYGTILSILIGLALHSSYKKAKYKYDANTYLAYVTNTIVVIIINTIVLLLIAIAFESKVSYILSLKIEIIILLIVYSGSMALRSCYSSFLSMEYDYKKFLITAWIGVALEFVCSVFLILTIFHGNRYLGRIIGITLPELVISIYIIYFFFRKKRPDKLIRTLKWGLNYSLPIVPHGISQIILAQFDRIMITNIIGSEAGGIYSFAYTIFSIVYITATSLDNAWTPWFFENMKNENYDNIKQKSNIYMGAMLAFCIIVMLICPEIIMILGGMPYYEARYCVVPLVCGGYFAFLYFFPAGIEYFYEKTKYIMTGTMLAAVINIILNYIYINKYGYYAAAYTTLITYILYFVFHYLISTVLLKKKVFSLNKIIKYSSINIVFMFIALGLLDMFWIRWGIAIGIGIIGIGLEEKHIGVIQKFIKSRK